MPSRRAAATRLIDWTGERAVPWTPDVQVVYEHFHRYLWARTLVRGRRVLDIGSGEGFGAALLAGAAASVTGIDIDPRTVEHSQLRYGAEALTFSVASATDLGHLADGAFDVIVAFEVIEHVEDHERVMAEIERLLSASGIVIMSTPDRHTYSEAMAQENVFHVRELSALEFRDLLGTRFAHVQLFGQRAVTGSRIEAVDGGEYGPSSSFALERPYDEWQEAAADVPPLYLLAVAGRSPLPEIARQSALSDYGLGLLREAEGAANERATELMARSEAAEADIRRALKQIDAERVERYEVQERVRISAADRDREAVEWARKLDLASQEAAAAHAGRERAQAEHEAATAAMRRELQRISESVSWRVFQKARGRLYGVLGGHTSPAGRAVSATLRTVNRVATRRRPTAAVATGAAADPTVHQDEQSRGWTIAFPTFAEPVVSIVIPVYNGAELTERCLRAVLHATDEIPYEVIVVDDGDDPEVRRLLDGLEGVVVLRNKENLGYLRSVNRGSAAARGQHILQLNNDTEPQPGCLAPLLSRLDSSPDIGIVVPKLLFPDGRLQEAGSIVWRDGNAYNYGFGAEEAAFPYNFTRDVDYGSAAAMLVRGSLWRELGGFDERFAPGYYEDVDLCFATRRHGQRVVYEPASRIIHVHGGSMGTDITVGAKRYQEINRSTFAEKWAHALTEQHMGPVLERVVIAADRRRGKRVFVVDHAVPEPDQDAGSLRMFHLVENLVALGYRVTFMPDNHAAPAPYTAQLQAMGVEVLYGEVNLPARLVGIAAETELAILSRPYVAARYLHLVREFLPGARLAYDTVDLHYVREQRRAQVEGNPSLARSTSFRELELGVARGSDVTLAVSSQEADRLRQDAPGLTVAVVPLANHVWDAPPPREGRSGLLFIGNFAHTPNVDAATFLVDRVMPIVWAREPDVRLVIAGGNAPANVKELSAPNVEVAGWVQDLDPLICQSVGMVAPLRYGAGVKGKIAQALASGLPVVTTPLGAEGLDAQAGTDILIGETPEELAEEILTLMGDAALWARLSGNGQALLRRTSSPEAQRETLRALLQGAGQA